MVEDSTGAFYLFSGGVLQLRLASSDGGDRLDAYLARARCPWQRVDCDTDHPLAALPALELSLS